jgi:acetyl esterase/lipase
MPRVARNTIFGFVLIISLTIFITAAAIAQNATNPDGATFDPDGTAHITRLVPMPKTVSPEAQQWLKEIAWEGPQPKDLAALRAGIDEWRKKDSAKALRLYPVKIEKTKIAGVHTDMITPLAETQKDRVLINLHGGGSSRILDR